MYDASRFEARAHSGQTDRSLVDSPSNRIEPLVATQAAAFLWVYDDARCLLSDRGYCQPIEEAAHMSMSFNLCSNAFIVYAFFDMAVLLRDRASPEFLCEALEARAQLPQATINVTLTRMT